MRATYAVAAAIDPRPGHETAHPAALKAFRDEDALWALTESKDRTGRRSFEVRRGERVIHRFYTHQEALDCLNDVGLTAMIIAGMNEITRAMPQRATAIGRRFR